MNALTLGDFDELDTQVGVSTNGNSPCSDSLKLVAILSQASQKPLAPMTQ